MSSTFSSSKQKLRNISKQNHYFSAMQRFELPLSLLLLLSIIIFFGGLGEGGSIGSTVTQNSPNLSGSSWISSNNDDSHRRHQQQQHSQRHPQQHPQQHHSRNNPVSKDSVIHVPIYYEVNMFDGSGTTPFYSVINQSSPRSSTLPPSDSSNRSRVFAFSSLNNTANTTANKSATIPHHQLLRLLRCPLSDELISIDQVCDGMHDCADGHDEDEQACHDRRHLHFYYRSRKQISPIDSIEFDQFYAIDRIMIYVGSTFVALFIVTITVFAVIGHFSGRDAAGPSNLSRVSYRRQQPRKKIVTKSDDDEAEDGEQAHTAKNASSHESSSPDPNTGDSDHQIKPTTNTTTTTTSSPSPSSPTTTTTTTPIATNVAGIASSLAEEKKTPNIQISMAPSDTDDNRSIQVAMSPASVPVKSANDNNNKQQTPTSAEKLAITSGDDNGRGDGDGKNVVHQFANDDNTTAATLNNSSPPTTTTLNNSTSPPHTTTPNNNNNNLKSISCEEQARIPTITIDNSAKVAFDSVINELLLKLQQYGGDDDADADHDTNMSNRNKKKKNILKRQTPLLSSTSTSKKEKSKNVKNSPILSLGNNYNRNNQSPQQREAINKIVSSIVASRLDAPENTQYLETLISDSIESRFSEIALEPLVIERPIKYKFKIVMDPQL